jgi:hypothetical protein
LKHTPAPPGTLKKNEIKFEKQYRPCPKNLFVINTKCHDKVLLIFYLHHHIKRRITYAVCNFRQPAIGIFFYHVLYGRSLFEDSCTFTEKIPALSLAID